MYPIEMDIVMMVMMMIKAAKVKVNSQQQHIICPTNPISSSIASIIPFIDLQSTVYSLQSTVYSLQSTVYSLQSTVYIQYGTLFVLLSTDRGTF